MMSSVTVIDAKFFLIWVLHVAFQWGQCYEQDEYEVCCTSYLVSSFDLSLSMLFSTPVLTPDKHIAR